eukprot:m.50592 g.50592  ORF g.50592 m.50592 type:complete len:119 (-) comp10893_c0_seq3:167-523(-)
MKHQLHYSQDSFFHDSPNKSRKKILPCKSSSFESESSSDESEEVGVGDDEISTTESNKVGNGSSDNFISSKKMDLQSENPSKPKPTLHLDLEKLLLRYLPKLPSAKTTWICNLSCGPH